MAPAKPAVRTAEQNARHDTRTDTRPSASMLLGDNDHNGGSLELIVAKAFVHCPLRLLSWSPQTLAQFRATP